jgi:hypothetical protein
LQGYWYRMRAMTHYPLHRPRGWLTAALLQTVTFSISRPQCLWSLGPMGS